MLELGKRPDLVARAFEFTILTAARTSEVLSADWSEIDLTARTWTVPGSHMKMGKEHRVPLSDAAAALLNALPGPRKGLVFPGFRAGRPLAKMALRKILKRMGRSDVTGHGFRSTFSTWAAERTTFSSDVVELALAHTTGSKVARSYRRTDQFKERARLMQAWADFCAGKMQVSADVIELRRGA
jgi:integrase